MVVTHPQTRPKLSHRRGILVSAGSAEVIMLLAAFVSNNDIVADNLCVLTRSVIAHSSLLTAKGGNAVRASIAREGLLSLRGNSHPFGGAGSS